MNIFPMKRIILFLALAASSFGAVAIPVTDIKPVTTGSLLGRNTVGTGAAEILTTIPSTVQDNITRTGTLVSGATGAGFTVALGTSTITGVLPGANGGTGVANNGKTFTLAGTGSVTFTLSATTDVTLPTSGTLATTAATVPSVAGTAGQVLVNGATGAVTGTAITLTLASSLTGINAVTSAAATDLVLTGNSGAALTLVNGGSGTVTLTPAGNASVIVGGNQRRLESSAGNLTLRGTTHVIIQSNGANETARFTSAANLLLGTTTDPGGAGNFVSVGSLTTGAPTAGSAGAWKLGALASGVALVVSTTTGIRVNVGGTDYTFATYTTNP